MSDMSMFFAANAALEVTEDFVVSERFKDADGKPVKWKLRSITEEKNTEIRKAATRKTKGKNGVYIPELDPNDYVARVTTSCVVFPDLQNAELQKSYSVTGAEALLRKMLLPGEYAALTERVQTMNGFDEDINELKDEVKN
ncbi:phage portal protein [Paenibacillus glucanolyticus]|uniref:phage tail assembly chaperone n=1 Tax=Paenibacillus glucanolyticus TaxID=59843 RepID=UPI0035E1057C